MKVEIEDVMFWMDAIRNSDDRYRTLESFWKGQVNSKVWLAERLEEMCGTWHKSAKIEIYGGWNGVLSSILFNTGIPIKHITSVDIDPTCQELASTVNKRQEMEGRFTAVTADMSDYDGNGDIVINTSCEHITQEQYEQWLSNQPDDALLVIQSNNYFELEEHIRCATDLDDFMRMSKIKPFWRGSYDTPKYTRYMLIGKKKNV